MQQLGKRIAARIRKGEGQVHAALAEGIVARKYWRYMDGESEAYEAFQLEVEAAVHERAEADLQAADDAVTNSPLLANWYKWKLPSRYRRIFGDLATKVELSGPGGGPILSANVDATGEQALEALKLAARRDPQLAGELKKLGSGEK